MQFVFFKYAKLELKLDMQKFELLTLSFLDPKVTRSRVLTIFFLERLVLTVISNSQERKSLIVETFDCN